MLGLLAGISCARVACCKQLSLCTAECAEDTECHLPHACTSQHVPDHLSSYSPPHHCSTPSHPHSCSLSFLAQLVLVVTLLPATRAGCRGPALAHPAAQRSTHALYGWLSWVGTPLPLPLAPFSQPEAIAECTTIMTFAQIAGGLLLPMLVEALAAAAAFQQHQQQRAAAGLPAERGMHACFYASVWDVCGEGELHMGPAISPLLLAWLLLAVTWDWCSFFLARG